MREAEKKQTMGAMSFLMEEFLRLGTTLEIHILTRGRAAAR